MLIYIINKYNKMIMKKLNNKMIKKKLNNNKMIKKKLNNNKMIMKKLNNNKMLNNFNVYQIILNMIYKILSN